MPAGRKIRPTELEVISPDPDRHAEQVYDLTGKVFSREGYFQWLDRSRTSYFANSHYDWKASTVGLLDGRIVTHWGVWGYRMRIGRANVRVGGIGAVATHGDYRKLGLMASTASAGIRRMRERGYDMSVLFGISDFYCRFGYVRAWPGTSWTVNVNDLPREKPRVKLEKFPVCYNNEIDRVYNRHHSGLTGTAVRPTYTWKRPDRGSTGYLWRGRGRKIEGYVIVAYQRGSLACNEFAGKTQQVLRVLGMLARARHCQNVEFRTLHYNSDLCRCLRVGTCTCTTQYTARGGAMVCTVNLPAALRKISGELSRRISRSHLSSWRGRLLIADKREKVVLDIGRTRVTVADTGTSEHAIRGGDQIAQLLIGTHEPMETVQAAGIKLTRDAKKLVKILFPREHPMLALHDHF